jgi:hypothetical protein
MRHTDGRVQLQALCGQWLPLAKTLLGKMTVDAFSLAKGYSVSQIGY